MAQLRRPDKFGQNMSSHAEDITGFNKSKMAAVPPSWIEFKGQDSSGTYLWPKCDDLLNLAKIDQAIQDILHF